MSFPKYGRYKDSGVEWLGEIPKHWEMWKLAHAFEIIGSGTTPTSDNANYYEGGNIAWLNTGDLNDGNLYECEKQVTELALATHSALKVYPAGTLVIAMYGATIGKLAILHFPSTVNQACCVFSGSITIIQKFLFYCFLGFRNQIVSMATGGGQPNINQEILRGLRLAVPPLPEQRSIATFLDRETTKIDELIKEQRQLIDLLKEKRQAVISHAVTKGLNPDAPMKDSAIEWLGEVPEHWEVVAIDYRYELALGKMLDEKKITGSHLAPYLRNIDVQWDNINIEQLPEMDFKESEVERYSLECGDLLVCEGGEVGRSAIWNGQLKQCYYQKALHRLRPKNMNRDFSRFMFYQMYAAVKNQYFADSEGKSTIAHLTAEALRRYRFCYPSIEEQRSITTFLDRATTELDELIAEAQHAIALLRERRTALISAAVTGKIDVRSLV